MEGVRAIRAIKYKNHAAGKYARARATLAWMYTNFFCFLLCLHIVTSYDNKSQLISLMQVGAQCRSCFCPDFEVCQSLKLSIPFSKSISFQCITANGSVT